MDYQKAIEVLANEIGCVDLDTNNRGYIDESEQKFMDACNTAISAMEELQEYKEIGTVKGYEDAIKAYNDCYFEKQELEQELFKYKQLGDFAEVKSAVEKQKPRKPKKDYIYCYPEKWCENCNNVVFINWKYCPKCGQKILWKEADENDS